MDRSISTIVAEAFMRRFAGMDRAYGTYDLTRPVIREKDGKKDGTAYTRREKVTTALWEKHLEGVEPGIGIIPIRDGNDCVFGCIDIDVYKGLSHQTLAVRLKRDEIPLIVCRSKSGGAHLYCFTGEPIPASLMKAKLGEIASYLGYGDCEIFPKQTQILTESGDVGQWVNAPYFGGTRGMRYAVNIEGNALSPEQFLDYVEENLVPISWFTEKIVINNEFSDGPPCLQALSQVGYPIGTRNDGLYNIGVYLKKSMPDGWEDELNKLNHKYMEPSLTLPEVQGVVKSVRKKDYTYSCTKQPICNHCNAALCRTRKYGVSSGNGSRFPSLGGLTKLNTKPPIWFWSVEGIRMEMSTEDLQDPRRFQRRCMDYLNIVPQIPSRPVWEAAVQHAMDTVTTVEAPADASPEGLFWDMVEKFCTGRAQALSIDEITLGKPFTEKGKTYFRLPDLLAYLSMHKFYEFKSTKIASMLKDAKAEHHFKILKGRGINYWSIAAFLSQSSGFDVPDEAKQSGEPF